MKTGISLEVRATVNPALAVSRYKTLTLPVYRGQVEVTVTRSDRVAVGVQRFPRLTMEVKQ